MLEADEMNTEHLCPQIIKHNKGSSSKIRVYFDDKYNKKWLVDEREGVYYQHIEGIKYCPWCGRKLETEPQLPKSQLQILQEKKDDMVDTKRLVDGLNKLLDDWYRDKENGHT